MVRKISGIYGFLGSSWVLITMPMAPVIRFLPVIFIARRLQPFLPPSTRVELRDVRSHWLALEKKTSEVLCLCCKGDTDIDLLFVFLPQRGPMAPLWPLRAPLQQRLLIRLAGEPFSCFIPLRNKSLLFPFFFVFCAVL